MKTRIIIAGYGNLGRAAIDNARHFPDLEVTAVLSRRPGSVEADFPVYDYKDAATLKGKADVVLMCGGSASDLPEQSPKMAELFNIVDSFDTHAKIPEHYAAVNAAASGSGTLAAISVGWDPGLFSLMRTLFSSVLPCGDSYTFWGKGVSQGHSDALRRIAGVEKAVQYTIPKDAAVNAVRAGARPALSVKDKHLRECFIVADNAEHERIRTEIVSMPHYFKDYDTVVHFITADEFDKNHTSLPHGGFVLRSGTTGPNTKHLLEFSIKLDSNPHFTSSVMLACARAVNRLNKQGKTGALTLFDIPLGYLNEASMETLRKELL